MFCPACWDEFRLEFGRSPDCEVSLVVRLLAAQTLSAEPEPSPEGGEDA